MNAPHLGRDTDPFASRAEPDRWRLPLETPRAASALQLGAPSPPPADSPVIEPTSEPAPAPADELAPADRPIFESPDVTARYAVAQLEELNSRVAGLTEDTTARTEAALEKVHKELRRLTGQREIDLTEQAASIFGAVQAGADALAAFSKTVGEVTDDLRTILNDALKAIGGTDGLAAWVAASATDIQDTREEFAASLGKIERDITLLRRRSNAESKPAKIDDDQVAFIVDAVTDAVLAALETGKRRR